MKNLHFVFLNTFLFLSYSIYAQTFSSVDILAGTASSNPYCITSFNGKAYFDCLGDTAYGYELWMSDGTAAGTTMVKDVNPGSGDSYINYLTVVGNKLFFQANDGTHGQELWVSDGTTAGTMMVADIWAGQGSSYPDYMTAFNGKLYFSANDSIHGEELWVSDGTAAGTSMLMDIWPGIEGSQPKGYGIGPGAYYIDEFNSINGKLYFQANDSIHGGELWSTDGTTAGTAMVADIYPGIPDSNPFFMTSFNGKIYFSAAGDTLDGWELWTTDGTAAGTTMVKNIDPGTTSSTNNGYGADVADNSGFVPFNGKLYFSAYQPATGYELWATDGTTAGTTLVKDILAGPGSSLAGSYYALTTFNNKLYFAANDSVNGTQLWASDGTAAGTTLLNILSNYTPFASNPGYFINYNNSLVFVASVDSSNLEQLFATNGTDTGTQILAPPLDPNLNPLGYIVPSVYSPYAIVNGSLYMSANFNDIGDELWIYNMPPAGIAAIAGGPALAVWPNPFSTSVTLSGLDAGGQYTVQVLDMTGREYYHTEISNPAQNTSVPVPDLAAGVYLVHIAGQGMSQTFKLARN